MTRDEAREQAARLQANPLIAPGSEAGRTEVVDCLLRHCHTKEHAERTMTMVLDGGGAIRSVTAEIARCAALTMDRTGFDCLRPAAIWDHEARDWRPL